MYCISVACLWLSCVCFLVGAARACFLSTEEKPRPSASPTGQVCLLVFLLARLVVLLKLCMELLSELLRGMLVFDCQGFL